MPNSELSERQERVLRAIQRDEISWSPPTRESRYPVGDLIWDGRQVSGSVRALEHRDLVACPSQWSADTARPTLTDAGRRWLAQCEAVSDE